MVRTKIAAMRRPTIVLILLLLLPVSVFASPGALVVVGGGGTGPVIVAKALELAGGKAAIVAVLPQSSAEPDAGDSSVQMWLEAGARSAAKVAFTDPDAAAKLRRATLIWMPGGDQNRFMKAIQGTGLDDVIRERHLAGVTIGGTSAGAAVLAAAMFTGDADLKSITAGATVIAPGLAVWPEVLIDQHFLTRQRGNRLISAVLDRPSLVGVGIDEGTAVVVQGSAFDVIGQSSVVVVDARRASVDRAAPGALASARGVTLTILHSGQRYSLK
jgi:cyanophycinase